MMMSTSDLLVLIGCALAAGVGMTTIGVLIEFALRKKKPAPLPTEQAATPPPAQPQAPPPTQVEQPEAAPPVPETIATQATPSEAPVEVAPLPPPAPVAPTPEQEQPLESPAVAPARAEPPEAVAVAPSQPAAAIAEPPEIVAAPPAAPLAEPAAEEAKPTVSRFRLGLRKTRDNFMGRLRAVIGGGAKAEEIYEGLEEALIAADVGVDASTKLVEAVRKKLKGNATADGIREALKEEIAGLLTKVERAAADSGDAPMVIMLVGVNGVGKTTTVAKLAAMLKQERGPVIVAAADTFRAAAIEQLEIWCDRVGAEMIKQKAGSDPAAVAFDAVKAAKARKSPTVLIDTAGRLQTKVNLMEELKKIVRVIGREMPGAPHETWLVLDANTGQNALSQAKIFADAVPLSGVVLAKLDSTAKGGVVVAIADRLQLPVRFVGVGEDIADLRPFDGREFAEELFAADEAGGQTGKSYAA
ncbi:MAG TPA: signal recognition particle-docking protein FtsY [Candidatus Binataceae bacterium]|nr:signal recognition particle-docking protein FtsY [Candidatus Binataceae bacterium]